MEHRQFEVRACAEHAIELVRQAGADKGLALGLSINPELPQFLIGNSHRIQPILINLLSSAIKFSAAGEVALTMTARKTDAEVELQCDVSDSGAGIPPEALSSLFDAFTQADSSTTRQFGGTGLGLTITQQLVYLMGGTIEATSMVSVGTNFKVSIPLTLATPDMSAIETNKLAHKPATENRKPLTATSTSQNLSVCWRTTSSTRKLL